MNGILIDDNNDLVQPLTIGNTDYQRVRIIAEAHKGEIKEYPTLGFGIDRFLKTVGTGKRQQFVNELQKELKSDGMKSAKVTVGNDLSKFKVEL